MQLGYTKEDIAHLAPGVALGVALTVFGLLGLGGIAGYSLASHDPGAAPDARVCVITAATIRRANPGDAIMVDGDCDPVIVRGVR